MLTRFRSACSRLFRFATEKPATTALAQSGRYNEKISKARAISQLYDLSVKMAHDTFVAPNATIIGEVYIGPKICIWGGTVLRGDINEIRLAERISIGENCVLFTAASVPSGLPADLTMQSNVAIQPGCTIYSSRIGKNVFVGANSVIMEGSVLENGSMIAPNSVVPPGRVVPSLQLWGGNPIKYIRDVEERDVQALKTYLQSQWERTGPIVYQFLPFNNAYLLRENSTEDELVSWDEASARKNLLERDYNPKDIT